MVNPCYFTNRIIKIAFNNTLNSHHVNHTNAKSTIKLNCSEIEIIYVNKILKEMAIIYARFINQYKFKYQVVYSSRFDEQDEDGQILDEIELTFNLNVNRNLTQFDIDNLDIRLQLEHQISNRLMKDSAWRFDEINSMTICFHKTTEMNGSNYLKIPLRSSAIINIANFDDKFCFFLSILVSLYPCKITHLNRVSSYRQNFDELNIDGFDFSLVFKCSDVHILDITQFINKYIRIKFLSR